MPPKAPASSSKPLKYQPKTVKRKSLQERQKLEREEEQKQQLKAQAARDEAKTEEQRERAKYGINDQGGSRGRGDGGRGRGGRGGFMGAQGSAREGQLSGIGGAAVEPGGGSRRTAGERFRGDGKYGPGGRGRGGGSNRGGSVLSGGVASGSRSTNDTSTKSIMTASTDDSLRANPALDEESRSLMPQPKGAKNENNFEDIDRVDSSGDEDIEIVDLENLDLLSTEDGGLAPVTMGRTPHRDRQFHINTDSSAAIANQKKNMKEKSDRDLLDAVKIESDSDQEMPTVSSPTVTKKEPPSSPESKMKPKRTARTITRKPASKPLSAEETQQRDNKRILLEELGPIEPLSTMDESKEGDVPPQGPVNPREDSLYLFQFPPNLPKLARPDAPIKIEDAPEDNATADAGAAQDNQETTTIVKQEDGNAGLPTSKEAKHTTDLQHGLVGKMHVWKSGKVTVDWGGVRMLVDKAHDSDFAETVVGLEMQSRNEKDGGLSGEYQGTAYSFGQVRGKMVVTPDWKGILGRERKVRKRRGRRVPKSKETEASAEQMDI